MTRGVNKSGFSSLIFYMNEPEWTIDIYVDNNHRYLREVDCSRGISFQNICFNKARVLVVGTNKAGRLGQTRSGRQDSLNKSAPFNRHIFALANSINNNNNMIGSMHH